MFSTHCGPLRRHQQREVFVAEPGDVEFREGLLKAPKRKHKQLRKRSTRSCLR
jgi:hypothetical protein